MSDEARLESIRLRLTPRLEASIRNAAAAGTLPPAIMETLSAPALESVGVADAPLESMMPVVALEAIVQRVGRPPLLVRNDRIELEPLDDFPAGTDTMIKDVETRVRSVGRVEFVNASMAWGGTGSVVEDSSGRKLVVTNRHVAKIVAKRLTSGKGVFLRSPSTGVRCGANVDFGEEIGIKVGNSRIARLVSVEYLAEDMAADVALLRIEATFPLPDPLVLGEAEADQDDLVAIIGYPAYDSRNDASDQARYFRDLYEVKRFAPGRILQALSARTTLTHDCTTLGGNSGSPLISLETGRMVGLHFSGVYGKANTAVGVTTLKSLLAGRVQTLATEAAGSEGRADGGHAPADLANRDGYDPDFIGAGLQAPWPGLPADVEATLAQPIDAVSGREHELRYTHFGVKYSADRRTPLMTAVNIDGSRSVRVKRTDDKWYSDGRIDAEIQLKDENFADAQIDRGHMVRREDPNWDDNPAKPAAATRANFDTFHFTNAAPQHSLMNQGKKQWQGLENYILDSSRTHGFRACVFTGPVLRDDDEDLDGVQVPTEYWKLVVMTGKNGGLHATAYLLSQGQMIRDILEKRSKTEAVEGFELGEYRTFQIAVRDLEGALGYDFSPYLAADPLAARATAEAVAADEPLVRRLEQEEDAVL